MGNKNKMILKKEVALVISAFLISNFANAQTIVEQDNTVLPPLTVRTESPDFLLSRNCDPNVMQSLNNQYINKRQEARNFQLKTLVRQQVDLTPPPQSLASGSCYEQAANNISSVMNTVDAIRKLFAGDLSGVGDKVKKAASNTLNNIACQQINNYTGKMTSGLSNGINNQVNGAMSQINNYSIGAYGQSINGGQIAQGLIGVNTNNYNPNSNYGTPYITGSQLQGNVVQGANTLGGTISNSCSLNNIAGCNPFK